MSTHHRTIRRSAAAVSIVLALGAVSVLPATASGGGVERRGDCSKTSDWRLKASPDDGRLSVEAEVRTNDHYQKWTWTLLHNGGVSAHGTASSGSSGTFKVERLLINAPGTDKIGWRSTNTVTHERCIASVTY